MEYSLMSRKAIMVLLLLGAAGMFFAKRADAACGMNKEELFSCKPSVSGSNPPKPSEACCSALATADLPCFCKHRNSLMVRLLGIDFDLAMQLPKKCGIPQPRPHC